MRKSFYCICLMMAVLCATTMAQDNYNILKIEGMVPIQDGTTYYYIKNVGTGLHMSYGGEWGKHCKESRAAHLFILENNSEGTVAIASLAGYLESNTLWMDHTKGTSKWTLQPVGGEYVNQYYLIGDNGRALTSVGNSAGVLSMTPLTHKSSQRWIFFTDDEMRENRMPKATAQKPYDATPIVKGAGFDLIDGESGWENAPAVFKGKKAYLDYYWKNLENYRKQPMQDCGVWSDDANLYNYCGVINGGSDEITITRDIGLPAGTYSVSFEAFYKYMQITTEQDQVRNASTRIWENSGEPRISMEDKGTMGAYVSINGETIPLESHPNNAVYASDGVSSTAAAEEFRDNDTYKHTATFYLPKSGKVSIVIGKPKTKSDETSRNNTSSSNTRTVRTISYPNQIFIDNVTLLYFGNKQLNESEVNEETLFESYLDANIDEFIESLPEEDREAAKEALENLDRDNITSVEDYYAALEELENAVTEIEQEKEKEEAMGGITTDGNGNIIDAEGNIIEGGNANLTGFIMNASFEKGTLAGWAIDNNASLIGVVFNKGEYATQGTNGNYFFNGAKSVRLTQSIKGLTNGVYKMTVALASGAGNTATLIGNDNQREVTLTKGSETFEDFSVKFRVTDGTATIGVVGGNYKADNFRLELLNDYLVLDENDTELVLDKLRSADHWYGNLTLVRTIKNSNWSTFVVPFDIPVSRLDGWEVKELAATEMDEDGNITLEFADAKDGIKAGVPYMVRNLGLTAEAPFTGFTLKDINVSTLLNDMETDHIAFRGVWTKGYLPKGSYFISGNKFYVSMKDNTDAIKGFRAYLEPKEASKVRSIGYRFAAKDEEGATEIDNSQLTNDNEATIVAIYTLGGVRIDEMQQGVNILQMSDGTTIKVIIK